MAERAKGSILYEILIVVLVIGLIFTIVYPSKIWKQEDELQNVCRARISALQQLEYRYMENVNSFTDSIPKLKENILLYPDVVDAVDSSINWDQLVTYKKMIELIRGLNLPDALREKISKKFNKQRPLWSLADWDSLEFKLIYAIDKVMSDSLFETDFLDIAVNWRELVGENKFWDILSAEQVPRLILNRTNRAIQIGKLVNEIREWKYYAPMFNDVLNSMIKVAKRKDVWSPKEKDKWEIKRREQWVADMDTMSQSMRDSVWNKYQNKLWEKNKELEWKDQWKSMWAKEKDTWLENNKDVWTRIVEKNWTDTRKEKWIKEKKQELPDSLVAIFNTIRDSLWKADRDSLYDLEFTNWENKNKKEVNEIIKNLWERDRRVTWVDDAHNQWIHENEKNPEKMWTYLKTETWLLEKDNLWRGEEKIYNEKQSVVNRLNRAIKWQIVLGRDRVQEIVNNLNLPSSGEMVKFYKKETGGKKSAVYKLGIVSLLRNELLKDIDLCPVAHQQQIVTVIDTSIIPKFEIKCPIVDTSKVPFVVKIDTATGDTTQIQLRLPFFEKVFGGGEIHNHGMIDFDAKKSWEKKAR